MALHNEFGKLGEKIAAEYLITKGYTIREQNWSCGKVEIDVVAELHQRLVIVEVKTRSSDYVDPLDSIDKKKQHNLVRAANAYINYWDLDMEVQFDIITIVGTPTDYKLEHIPDAFYPPLKTY
ncbi:MAG: YraN family protein [Muribaculaceae bacterium]|nr:YraN family protein [Muribaculaceae bacterium]